MAERIKTLIIKYREIIVYILVGCMTTAVSWIMSYILKLFLNDQIVWQNAVINAVSWIAANAVAYPANRTWVFRSRNPDILKECIGFLGSRVATGLILEVGLMALLVNAMHINFWVSKFLVCILVTVGNYVLSKLVIFRRSTEDDQNEQYFQHSD